MYELIPITEHSWYMDCPSRVGIVCISPTEVIAIDSGSDRDVAKKLLRGLNAAGRTLTAVFNTHSHADHIGGNRWLQEQTGCALYAPGIECAFANHTILEPALLYGGLPFRALHHKFLLAPESTALPLTQAALPAGMEIIPLPGHSPDMVGFRTADDVVYLADVVASRETLSKYGLCYLWDVQQSLDTLAQVGGMQARCFVPSHAAPAEDIAPLAACNIEAIHRAGEAILSLCAEPIGPEDLLQQLFAHYGLTMNAQQYVLIGSTMRAYLTWLQSRGLVDCFFEDNRMYWRQC